MSTQGQKNIFPLQLNAGIKRDGTRTEGSFYEDGQHVRFQRSLPRKMGGYRSISEVTSFPVRTVFVHTADGINRIFLGSAGALEYTDVDSNGIGGGLGDRTPAGFTPDDNNLWQMDTLYDGGGDAIALIAHAAPNLSVIDSETARPVYSGIATDNGPLTVTSAIPVSGGVCCSPPYAFAYGSNGFIQWCVPNDPTNWTDTAMGAGNARIAKQKIVRGIPARTGQGPGAIFWSLDAVITANFVGDPAVFSFTTISSQSSILSSSSVIEYDSIYYWVGVDRFLLFNGVIRELPNNMNLNWFFDNLNFAYRNKVFAIKIPRWGEIWWFFPFGDSTECNAAVIYNIRENTWYDTRMDRFAGYFAQVFHYPVMSANEQSGILVRRLNGTPSSNAGGNAALAFDGNFATFCQQDFPSGSIIYDFGANSTRAISEFSIYPQQAGPGINSVVFEYSNDLSVWTQIGESGSAPDINTPWKVTLITPIRARAFRARNLDNAQNMAVSEFFLMEYGGLLYQHEFGVNKVIGSEQTAIQSYFETCNISFTRDGPFHQGWPGTAANMYLKKLEPDFIQSGDLTLTVRGQPYPNVPITDRFTSTFNDTVKKIDIKGVNVTLMTVKFESNQVNGDYQMGEVVMEIDPGDGRP